MLRWCFSWKCPMSCITQSCCNQDSSSNNSFSLNSLILVLHLLFTSFINLVFSPFADQSLNYLGMPRLTISYSSACITSRKFKNYHILYTIIQCGIWEREIILFIKDSFGSLCLHEFLIRWYKLQSLPDNISYILLF